MLKVWFKDNDSEALSLHKRLRQKTKGTGTD